MQGVSGTKPQRSRNLFPDCWGGASSECNGLWLAQPVARAGQPPVARPEIMAPLRDAVGLVYHQQPGTDALSRQLLAQPLQSLGRYVQHP
jgi:hypothetical protein